jgi:acyl carrier protein
MSFANAASPVMSATPFKDELLQFVNLALPKTRSKPRELPAVDSSTLLFESGLIDSLAIVQLIAFVERATGREIPPRMVVMKHFRSVDAICDAFGPREIGV